MTFEEEFEELCKKYEFNTIDSICYVNPEYLDKAKKDLAEYKAKYNAWLKDNPEPLYDLSKIDMWAAWGRKRREEVGIKPYWETVDGRDEPEYVNSGVWYSSRC